MSKDVEKPKAKLKYKVPKKVGAAVDLLFKVRAQRKKVQAVAEAEKDQEKMIEDAIFNLFKKDELEGARGKLAQASIKRSEVANVDDFDALWAYAKKTDSPDLFRRQVVLEAVRARWADKKVVPGVSPFTRISLHLTPAGK